MEKLKNLIIDVLEEVAKEQDEEAQLLQEQ